MYKRGDKVWVQGFGGQRAVLYVWEERRTGLMLCTERGFRRKMRGEPSPIVGFPHVDIKGPFDGKQEEEEPRY